MATKAVLIIRVSDPKQEKEGLSLDNQEEAMNRYAEEHQFEVVQRFRFQESADRKIRNRFMEVVKYVKAHPDVRAIIGYRVDRMTRNYRDQVLIDDLRLDYDKEIHFVYDRLVIDRRSVGRDIQDWDTKVYLAKQYLNRLREDAIVSARYKLERGERPGEAPYGYRNRKNEYGRSWIYPDPFEAKVVRSMLNWYASRAYSMEGIRGELKAQFGVTMSKGKIDYILKNRFYCGQMLHGGRWYPHRYERLVSPSLFDEIQKVKEGYHKQPFKQAGLPFMYRGIIRCGECGCVLTPERKRKKDQVYHYYHCTEYRGKHKAAWLREEELTRQFGSLFSQMAIPEKKLAWLVGELNQTHIGERERASEVTSRLQAEWRRYETRLKAMYEDKLDGLISAVHYLEKAQEYRAEQEQLTHRLDDMQEQGDRYYVSAASLLQVATRAQYLFEVAEVSEKVLLLRTVLQNCTLESGKLLCELKTPYDTILQYSSRQAWLPLLNAFRNRDIELDCNQSCVDELLAHLPAP